MRTPGPATLRRRPAFALGAVLRTAAPLLFGSVPLGLWEGTAEGALAALLTAPALSSAALRLHSALHTRELLRLCRDRFAPGTTAPGPPPGAAGCATAARTQPVHRAGRWLAPARTAFALLSRLRRAP
ncbi:hypothetical protein JGS22_009760 [Streptomyces sp. P38-E01]|uniref:Uncharacterized protein n=1 Tax=Streptomyces tardus TaxID=2780544 RepID=A0A949JKI5_9ACTN|nr:hypothetical protein [Streptomyces tardus]MBU7597894.1 hypothetical protein [Streptomyces tardus]